MMFIYKITEVKNAYRNMNIPTSLLLKMTLLHIRLV